MKASFSPGPFPIEEGLLPHGEPTEEDARRALRAAETVMNSLQAALGELTGP